MDNVTPTAGPPGKPASVAAAPHRRRVPREWSYSRAVLKQGVVGALAGLLVFAWMENLRSGVSLDGWSDESLRHLARQGVLFGCVLAAFLVSVQDSSAGSGLRMLFRGAIAAMLGGVMGAVSVLAEAYVAAPDNWGSYALNGNLANLLGWGLFGAGVGLAANLTTRPASRIMRPVLGGLLGGILGGFCFDYLPQLLPGLSGSAGKMFAYASVGGWVGFCTAALAEAGCVAWITIMAGTNQGRCLPVYRTNFLLGRDELVDIPLFGDSAILRRHAQIQLDPVPRIRTLGPSAAVRVDDQIVTDAPLHDGSLIEIGRHLLCIHLRGVPSRAALDSLGIRAHPGPEPASPTRTGVPEAPPLDPASLFQPGQPLMLRVIGGGFIGAAVPLSGDAVTVGRETDNSLPLPDAKVSRHHLKIERQDLAWVVTDLDSKNGTRLNGLRINRAGLMPGDYLYVGDTAIAVELAAPAASQPAPNPQRDPAAVA